MSLPPVDHGAPASSPTPSAPLKPSHVGEASTPHPTTKSAPAPQSPKQGHADDPDAKAAPKPTGTPRQAPSGVANATKGVQTVRPATGAGSRGDQHAAPAPAHDGPPVQRTEPPVQRTGPSVRPAVTPVQGPAPADSPAGRPRPYFALGPDWDVPHAEGQPSAPTTVANAKPFSVTGLSRNQVDELSKVQEQLAAMYDPGSDQYEAGMRAARKTVTTWLP